MFGLEGVQIQTGWYDINGRAHPVAFEHVFGFLTWRDDGLHVVAHKAGEFFYDPFSRFIHPVEIKRIDVVGVVGVHRMIRVHLRDAQIVGDLPSIKRNAKLLLRVNHIEAHFLDVVVGEVDWTAHGVSIKPLQLHAGQPQNFFLGVHHDFRALMVRDNKDGVAELLERLSQRHDTRHHTVNIRKI